MIVDTSEPIPEPEGGRDAFIEAALKARERMIATGMAYDGDEVGAYLRAKVRGEKPVRPRLKSIEFLLKKK